MDFSKFKFIDEGFRPIMHPYIDLNCVVNELCECLKSEGVEIDIFDTIHFLDIFIRTSGLTATVSNSDVFGPINSTIGYIKITDTSEKIKNGTIDKEIYNAVIKSINNIANPNSKFMSGDDARINAFTDKIDIVVHEYTTFFNNVIEYIHEVYNGLNKLNDIFNFSPASFLITYKDKEGIDHIISFTTMELTSKKIPAVNIYSNIITGDFCTDGSKPNEAIIADTFSKENADAILAEEDVEEFKQ